MNIREKMIEAIAVRLSLRAGHGVNNVSDFWRAQADEILTDLEPMIRALSALEPGEATTAHPYCWVLPGDDTANADGWIDARISSEGEFTKPLYASPITPPSPAVTDAMVEAAEAAVYQRHERGFLVKPLIDPIDMRAALAAALSGAAATNPDQLANKGKDLSKTGKDFSGAEEQIVAEVSPTPATVEALDLCDDIDDRTRPLLLAQAAKRGAREWRDEDVGPVIARLLAENDRLRSSPTAALLDPLAVPATQEAGE